MGVYTSVIDSIYNRLIDQKTSGVLSGFKAILVSDYTDARKHENLPIVSMRITSIERGSFASNKTAADFISIDFYLIANKITAKTPSNLLYNNSGTGPYNNLEKLIQAIETLESGSVDLSFVSTAKGMPSIRVDIQESTDDIFTAVLSVRIKTKNYIIGETTI